MRSSTVVLTYEGLETLMSAVADRLNHHCAVASILTLNHMTASAADIREALAAADVQLDPRGGITIRPTGMGRRILIPISNLVADAIDDELGEVVMFVMQL